MATTKKKKPVRTKKTVKPKEKSFAGTASTTAKKPVRTKSTKLQTKSGRKGPEKETKRIEDQKPEFEKSLQDLAGGHQPAEEPKTEEKVERRGGARPGAGRPKGVTDDFAAVNRLPDKANKTLVPVLQIPFKTWAKATGVKEMEIDKKDAEELALPVTQLLEFYFPGRIPEIAWVWLCFTGTVYRTLEPRLEKLAQMRTAKVSVPAGEGPSLVRPPGRSPTGAADPAIGFPKANE